MDGTNPNFSYFTKMVKCIYSVNKLHSCQNKSVSDVQQIYMHTFNTGQQLNVRKKPYSYDFYIYITNKIRHLFEET